MAVPLAWEEVNPRARTPPTFTLTGVAGRLDEVGGPWDGIRGVCQSITRSMREAPGLNR